MTTESSHNLQRIIAIRFIADREFFREQFFQLKSGWDRSGNPAIGGAVVHAGRHLFAMPRVAPAMELILRARHNAVGLLEGEK